MRTLVTFAALALLLTGCFDSPKKHAIRDSLIRLQAELDSGISLTALQMWLTLLDADIRTAVLDGAIDNGLAQQLDQTLKLGRGVEKAWRTNFYCITGTYIERQCWANIMTTFKELGVSEQVLADWQKKDEADLAKDMAEAVAAEKRMRQDAKKLTLNMDLEERIKRYKGSVTSLSNFEYTDAVGELLDVLNKRTGETVAMFQH